MPFCQAYCFNFFSSQNSFFLKQVVLIFNLVKKSFFVKYIVRLLAWHIKFEKLKTLKKKISEELMLIAQHPKKCWNFCVSENQKKEIEPIFTE